MNPKKNKNTPPVPSRKGINGFTLVELSIVIVIVGLLVAGVVAGRGVVHTAKLQKVISDIDKIKLAINNFNLQYNAFPGDLANASAYWSGELNGDGDRIITGSGEAVLLWRHLELAKLYPGTYTGVWGSGIQPGINAAAAPFPRSWYNIWRHVTLYDRPNRHSINLNSGTGTWNGVVSTTDAVNIDRKVDDGLASKGMIYTAKGNNYNIVNNVCTLGVNNFSSNPPINYNTGDTTPAACWMLFFLEK